MKSVTCSRYRHFKCVDRGHLASDLPIDVLYPQLESKAETIDVILFRQLKLALPMESRFQEIFTLRGRIKNRRDAGSALIFLDLQQNFQSVQVVLREDEYIPGRHEFHQIKKLLHVGCAAEFTGSPGYTPNGTLSLFATKHMKLLSMALKAPDSAIEHVDTRFRKRHADLWVNQNARDVLRMRSDIVRLIRQYYDTRGFLEVETPIISDHSSGAMARPFLTNSQYIPNKSLTLRIAPEIWLKRLVIGGFDQIYEIGKSFRNEGIDATHNPEFTTLESYCAYANISDLMTYIEDLLHSVSQAIGSTFKQASQSRLVPPFARLEFIPSLEKALGTKLPLLHSDEALKELAPLCPFELSPNHTLVQTLDDMFDYFIASKLDAATFVCNPPEIMAPLAKSSMKDGQYVSHRIELYINGQELCNAYEEENSPPEQRRKLLAQSNQGSLGENEKSYIAALEHGLPPTGGIGLGIDRLCMLLSQSGRISEVLSFGGLRTAVRQGITNYD